MGQERKDLGIIDSHLDHKDAVSTARYSLLSGEETLETGAEIFKRLYGQIDSECIQKCIQMGARAPQAMQLQGL